MFGGHEIQGATFNNVLFTKFLPYSADGDTIPANNLSRHYLLNDIVIGFPSADLYVRQVWTYAVERGQRDAESGRIYPCDYNKATDIFSRIRMFEAVYNRIGRSVIIIDVPELVGISGIVSSLILMMLLITTKRSHVLILDRPTKDRITKDTWI